MSGYQDRYGGYFVQKNKSCCRYMLEDCGASIPPSVEIKDFIGPERELTGEKI